MNRCAVLWRPATVIGNCAVAVISASALAVRRLRVDGAALRSVCAGTSEIRMHVSVHAVSSRILLGGVIGLELIVV